MDTHDKTGVIPFLTALNQDVGIIIRLHRDTKEVGHISILAVQ